MRWALSLLLAAVTTAPALARDPRSVELVRLECASELGRRDVTLFEDGTLRRRAWDEAGELEMQLADLPPADVANLLSRIRSLDLTEVDEEPPAGPGGWVESCEIELELEEDEVDTYRFSKGSTLPLGLSKLAAYVEELGVRAEPGTRTRSLPEDYAPAVGDVLLSADGFRYEVLGWTSDGRALELAGLDRSVTIYVFPGGFDTEFVALIESEGG